MHRVLLLAIFTSHSFAGTSLIVVEDRGGASALPYYQALNLSINHQPPAPLQTTALAMPIAPPRVNETDFLPVRSAWLSPGDVQYRVIQAPRLTPLFLIGDDPRSREWLTQRRSLLRSLHAVGLVVNVKSATALAALRQLAPDITLVPTPGDDLAQRLPLRHYPVLITATGIEQ